MFSSTCQQATPTAALPWQPTFTQSVYLKIENERGLESKCGTESYNFPTQQIMGAQNVNFAPNPPEDDPCTQLGSAISPFSGSLQIKCLQKVVTN